VVSTQLKNISQIWESSQIPHHLDEGFASKPTIVQRIGMFISFWKEKNTCRAAFQ